MVALILGFAGAALWQAGSPRRQPELELDPVRREARLVCRHGGKSKLVARRKFKDLDRAEISDDHVRLWDADGAILADVALADANMARLVRRTLSMAGVRT